MAYTRRTLAAAAADLRRRIRPSLPLLLPHRDDTPSSPRSIPPFSSSPFHTSKSLLLGSFYSPLGIQSFNFRSYSSAPASGSNEIEYIQDVTSVLTDTTAEASASAPAPFPGEVAAAAADSFFPVAALQHLIDAIHTFSGLNWWACIALTTILIRGATVPLLIKQMKATVKLNDMRPELEQLKAEMDSMDPQSVQEGQKKMKALFHKHGVTPFTPLKGMFIQGPIFMSFFFAIRNMVEKVPSLKGGGAFWFTDLTTPDPFYLLPVLTSLTFLATVELNMQEGMEGNPMAKTMKNFSRVLALLTIPFTAGFPKAIFCYWITSNIFSLSFGFVIRRPQVRHFFDLPAILPQTGPTTQPNFSFFGQSKPLIAVNSPVPVKGTEQTQSSERKVSSSTVMSHRIRNLEKSVKARNKSKRR